PVCPIHRGGRRGPLVSGASTTKAPSEAPKATSGAAPWEASRRVERAPTAGEHPRKPHRGGQAASPAKGGAAAPTSEARPPTNPRAPARTTEENRGRGPRPSPPLA